MVSECCIIFHLSVRSSAPLHSPQILAAGWKVRGPPYTSTQWVAESTSSSGQEDYTLFLLTAQFHCLVGSTLAYWLISLVLACHSHTSL